LQDAYHRQDEREQKQQEVWSVVAWSDPCVVTLMNGPAPRLSFRGRPSRMFPTWASYDFGEVGNARLRARNEGARNLVTTG
jgi:hypothetical protein